MVFSFVVIDASEAVNAKVAEELAKRKHLPRPFKNRVVKRVAKVANNYAMASKAVELITPKLCEELPLMMKKKGLVVHVEEAFREGPFVVLELQVIKVNMKVVKEEVPSTTVRVVEQLLGMIGTKKKDKLESNYLSKVAQNKMESSLADLLRAELAERKLVAEAEVFSEEKQARFFFPMVRQVRQAKADASKDPSLPKVVSKAI